ncbi:NADH-quinone oxidoreductase subunit M [Micromonospora phaseoli]|uniref:NADH-quinone oxidoreductase subunit M n=1 Tax=Micromonospora phaseoli TaxID=1144548 RepID=A0A1H6X7G9_9ACTN|nr:NADH-quinone oxidoreductase subunit M [Micromonospora phaseoli]PZW02132.1 NADH dehydrogenase subunit M [Micromonospora phaseoli]GIJ75867.1 NADH-quinone oxidoreductase subunit M [Micromonospora phaseoli]SEJ25123.1 NADH-quinone oxidoreductase subunit M [Micromonospora phaseoli]
MSFGDFLLVAVLALPALGALLVAATPGDRLARMVGTVAAALTLVAAVALVAGRDAGWSGYLADDVAGAVLPWHSVDLPWVPGLDLRFHLGVDGISWPLVVLTALLTLLCCGYSLWRVPGGGSGRALVALLLVVEVGILGTFLALDLVLFFLFFEVVLLPMYAIIVGWGGDGTDPAAVDARRRAGRKFALYTLFGSVLLLVGVYVVVAAAGTADVVALTGGTDLSRNTQLAAFTLLALAFAVKSPLWPLHSWLPDAHTQAPTVGSVLLAGVLLKMGTYGLIRVAVGVAPEGARWAAPVLGVLAVAAILVGSLVCLAQTELKRLIAYSSVGHMGFVLLGVATLTATGIQAALIGNVAHGIITGLLFFLAGAIKDRAHSGALSELSGLRETAPRLSGLLAFAAVASLGLPGLAGFWGEAFAVVAAVEAGGALWTTLAVLAAVGGALTAAYLLRLLRQVTHGPPSPPVATFNPGLAGAELAAWTPLVLLALAVGLAPTLVLGVAEAPVEALLGVLR